MRVRNEESGFEPGGREFESLRAHHIFKHLQNFVVKRPSALYQNCHNFDHFRPFLGMILSDLSSRRPGFLNILYLNFSTTCSTSANMTTTRKLLEKLRQNPRDWRIEQLETIARRYGINVRKSGGSQEAFDHPEWIELLCISAHRRRCLLNVETLRL
jgi:hypothetical protein